MSRASAASSGLVPTVIRAARSPPPPLCGAGPVVSFGCSRLAMPISSDANPSGEERDVELTLEPQVAVRQRRRLEVYQTLSRISEELLCGGSGAGGALPNRIEHHVRNVPPTYFESYT